MDDFIKDLTHGEPYEGPYKASEIFKLTRDALLDSLAPVFHQIKKAANSGSDYVDIKEDLTDDQKWILEKYEYEVVEFDEDDEEFKEGFKWQLQWFNDYYDQEDGEEGEE
jgi:hypothetical protein